MADLPYAVQTLFSHRWQWYEFCRLIVARRQGPGGSANLHRAGVSTV